VPASQASSFFDAAFAGAFATVLAGTLKVFAMGAAGFVLIRRGWLPESALQPLGILIAILTLPCQILHRFATRFDPEAFPTWPLYALAGAAITGAGLLLGGLISRRRGDNNEAAMLVGFQNAGFFVLPMLQAILPPREFERASILLFVLVVPFNASLWLFGSRLLLNKKGFDPKVILTPTLCATLGSLFVFGLFHDAAHRFDTSMPWQILFGDSAGGSGSGSVGAVQLVGDLTVPLATIVLGASIATSLRGKLSEIRFKRAIAEIAVAKMIAYPLLGYVLLRWILPPVGSGGDRAVWVLLMLEFAAPPAINIPVFARQHGYEMRLIPTACLVCYALGLLTVPLWVALALR
jgi:predicted permease